MRKKNQKIEVFTGVCLTLLLTVSLLSIDGYAWAIQNEKPGKTDVVAAQDSPALKSRKEKLSYALGMVLGNKFRDQSVEVELDLYVRGLKDGLAGSRTLLTAKEAQALVKTLQIELERKQAVQQGAATKIPGIQVFFKLDSRLRRGMFMGDRWVSPSTYTSTLHVGTELTVKARAQSLDAEGRRVAITPKWIPADPEMVTVLPNQGKEVKIIVKRPGQTSLQVVLQEITKELLINAMDKGNAMQVEIFQDTGIEN